MPPSPGVHRVVVDALGLGVLLAPAAAFAGGGGEAIGLAVLFFAAINLVLYLFILLCWIGAAACWRRNRSLGIALLLAGCAPLAHYGFEYTRTQFEPQRRAGELAALQRESVPPRSQHSIEVFRGFTIRRELQTLVATGVVPEILTATGNEMEAYVRQEGWECLEDESSGGVQAEVRRVVLARQAFRVCAKAVRRARSEASLQLFVDTAAPHQYRGPACVTGLIDAVELRWAPAQGGKLVAFVEPRMRKGYGFPPLLLPFPPPRVWQCPSGSSDPAARDEELRRLDAFLFVAQALGYRSIDDFPRSRDENAVPQALERLQSHLQSRFAHDDILALMGQWPATHATDALIGGGTIAAQATHGILVEAAHLLGDPRQFDRQRRLYPQLASHVPALLQACSLHAGEWDAKEPCRILAQVREAAKR